MTEPWPWVRFWLDAAGAQQGGICRALLSAVARAYERPGFSGYAFVRPTRQCWRLVNDLHR
jgi:hypothetical protein